MCIPEQSLELVPLALQQILAKIIPSVRRFRSHVCPILDDFQVDGMSVIYITKQNARHKCSVRIVITVSSKRTYVHSFAISIVIVYLVFTQIAIGVNLSPVVSVGQHGFNPESTPTQKAEIFRTQRFDNIQRDIQME